MAAAVFFFVLAVLACKTQAQCLQQRLLPPPVPAQVCTTPQAQPAVATTIVDNSVSNALANAIQLLIVSNLVENTMKPNCVLPGTSVCDSFPVQTTVYSPTVDCLTPQVDFINPFASTCEPVCYQQVPVASIGCGCDGVQNYGITSIGLPNVGCGCNDFSPNYVVPNIGCGCNDFSPNFVVPNVGCGCNNNPNYVVPNVGCGCNDFSPNLVVPNVGCGCNDFSPNIVVPNVGCGYNDFSPNFVVPNVGCGCNDFSPNIVVPNVGCGCNDFSPNFGLLNSGCGCNDFGSNFGLPNLGCGCNDFGSNFGLPNIGLKNIGMELLAKALGPKCGFCDGPIFPTSSGPNCNNNCGFVPNLPVGINVEPCGVIDSCSCPNKYRFY